MCTRSFLPSNPSSLLPPPGSQPDGPRGATGAAPGELLFPFDEDAAECPDCLGVFHRQCFKQQAAAAGCPRCIRKRRKKKKKGGEGQGASKETC